MVKSSCDGEAYEGLLICSTSMPALDCCCFGLVLAVNANICLVVAAALTWSCPRDGLENEKAKGNIVSGVVFSLCSCSCRRGIIKACVCGCVCLCKSLCRYRIGARVFGKGSKVKSR